MLGRTYSVALVGTEARIVDVEVHVDQGLPRTLIVGLPATSVREAEQRVRAALASSGEGWPGGRVVANLAPGGLRKDGTHLDLALALGVLAARERIPRTEVEEWVSVGELTLTGALRPVPGVLAAALACRDARARGILCPEGNAAEAAVVEGIRVVAVASLAECLGFFRGTWEPKAIEVTRRPPGRDDVDLAEVRGHAAAKRAAEIAAAGGHNLLLTGPPGSGKTMLARRIPTLLPAMTMEESLEVTRIFSIARLLADGGGLVERRPFRAPHHSISPTGLVGGGTGVPRPGEISLATHGVLFLDELPLFRRDVLEGLRGPLEDGVVRIARSGGTITFPARFSLVAAMNPCPCGYFGSTERSCRCSEARLRSYGSRVSGPLLDRFDIQADMQRLGRAELLGQAEGESSAEVRNRVEAARRVQAARYGSSAVTNATAPRSQIERAVTISEGGRRMLGEAIDALKLSGRGLDRVRRLARTIADLAQREHVDECHLGEALMFRTNESAGEAA